MFNLGVTEIIVIVVVAILIFGPRLPHAAAEMAGWVMKFKRSLSDLRRDSGIDREISEVRRQVENAVPREVRNFNVERTVKQGVQSLKQEVADPVAKELESAARAAQLEPHEGLEDRREPTAEQAPAVSPAAPDPEAPPGASDPRPSR